MKKKYYKTVDLFGNEQLNILPNPEKNVKNLFTEYEAFTEKFEIKKTTDDCYTPSDVFKVVLDYVAKNYNLENKTIVRPFYPNGDYQLLNYDNNTVVIDNPPFSIIAEICRFYLKRNIKFFIFAPHLTNFSSDIDVTHIVAAADIVYENGANVKTSFLSNLFGDIKIIGCPEIYEKIKAINNSKKLNLPQYLYPKNIVTVSKIAYFVEKGVPITINKNEVNFIRQLDSQKSHKKSLFGSGFIASDAAAERMAQAQAQAQAQANVIEWELSKREKNIINNLNNS